MNKFNGKIFNPSVFEKYVRTLSSTKENAMINSAIFKNVNKYKVKMANEAGGNYVVEPIKGRIGGDAQNYDGETDITSNTRKTFYQGKIAIGRDNAWGEDDFTEEITGTSFLAEGNEIKEYWDEEKQKIVLAMLEGIFSMNGSNDFASKHTLTVAGELSGSDCNKAAQKAIGDKKQKLRVMFMHSAVATALEGLQLLNFLKYTDKQGIERDLTLAQFNGKLVIIDDEMPVTEVAATYALTSDAAVVAGKTYYTRSGSQAAGYTYTVVASPATSGIASYYEKTANAYTQYTSYMFSEGFFEYEDLGVRVPYEVARDAKDNGGHTDLISRVRMMIVPELISYTKTSQATLSPTLAELRNGSNWELANDDADTKEYVNDKLVPVVRIISRV